MTVKNFKVEYRFSYRKIAQKGSTKFRRSQPGLSSLGRHATTETTRPTSTTAILRAQLVASARALAEATRCGGLKPHPGRLLVAEFPGAPGSAQA